VREHLARATVDRRRQRARRDGEDLRLLLVEGQRAQVRLLGQPVAVADVALEGEAGLHERADVAIHRAQAHAEAVGHVARAHAPARPEEQRDGEEPVEAAHARGE
jgi:hypothetical protein